ncbi:hypothetical protein HMPREF3192_00964 [Atopobium deltae]|uniref:Uncharacterized protein n=1 Tax=Atopobium deltae TaxID=1393034 RepID=A0A133XST2_9ACTN|nr:hypothetical protein HMPREF3192_00964 [Atopobium deltae]
MPSKADNPKNGKYSVVFLNGKRTITQRARRRQGRAGILLLFLAAQK